MSSSRAVAVLCCALILFAAGVQAQSPKSATPAVLGSGVQEWTYSYDAAGNVKQIANTSAATTDKYAYDTVGRVIVATTDGNQQTFSYDRFGNRLTAARVGTAKPCLGNTECGGPLDIDSTTNRLGSTAAAYDDAGSVIRLNSISEFFYDALGMLRRSVISGTDEREYIYTADDERIAVRRVSVTDWTIRHLDGKPLREFRETALEGMVWSTDHIWRSGQLLATVSRPDSGASAVTYHYHLDHLGTPRLITDAAGVEVARHSYYAFGPELQIAPHESPELRLKFTGHERDLIPGNANTLDYMHARYYSATMGRFLSVDPVLDVKRAMTRPQMWNRYAYVSNNPVNATDPDGRSEFRLDNQLGREQLAVIRGEMTMEQYNANNAARFNGAMTGYSMVGVGQAFQGLQGLFAMARAGFSAGERGVISTTASILRSGGKELIKAFQAGEAKELTIAGQKIIVQPDAPISGMTLHGEKAFVLGKEAFKNSTELAKTVLHEMYRLTFQEGASASGVSATASTKAAAAFADKAFEVLRRVF